VEKEILIFLHSSNVFGANLSVLAFAKTIVTRYRVLFITPDSGPFCQSLLKSNLRYKVIPFKNWVYLRWDSRNVFYGIGRKLLWFMTGITHLIFNFLLCFRYLFFFWRKSESIYMSNSAAIGHGYFLSRVLRKPHVWHLREFLDLDYSLHFYFGRSLPYKWIRNSKITLTMSNAIKDHFLAKDAQVIYDGFKISLSDSIRSNRKSSRTTFLLIGLINHNKGHQDALSAIADSTLLREHSNLIVVGSGQTTWLKEIINNLNLQGNVELLDYTKDIEKVYSLTDVVLMCSRNEAMGRVTIESMLYEKPVIGRATGGTTELITDQVNGLLYVSVAELRKHMEFMVENQEKSTEMGKRARIMCETKFALSEYVEKIAEKIESL